jgi:hypothetical protein
MNRLSALMIFLLLVATASQLSARDTDKEVDLQALYQQIDDAIGHSSHYVGMRVGQITEARKSFRSESNLKKKFGLAEQLFSLYEPYRNDSALYFADVCIALADSLHRYDKVGLYQSLKAHQCSNTGRYVESLELLKQVDKKTLSREGLTEYYAAWMHVCGEIASYSLQESERQRYFDYQDGYRDSVLAVAEEGSEEYLHLKMDVLCARMLFQDALSVSDSWLNKVSEGTHELAYAAFYRSVVYDKLRNDTKLRYWLSVSALADIKSAVFNQASLFMLAERLCDDGDYERAYRYMCFSEACNTAFSPQLRNYQVRYVENVLKKVYQNSQDRYTMLLTIACVAVLLLLAVVVWLLIRLRRH